MVVSANKMKSITKKKNLKTKPKSFQKFHNRPKKGKKMTLPDKTVQHQSDDDDPKDSGDENSVLSMECEEYEILPRFQRNQVKVRNLLPVKNKDGFEYRSEILPHDDVEDEKPLPKIFEKKFNDKSVSLVQSYAVQQRSLETLKCKVALLCTSVIEDPENNMKALKELITMLQNTTTTMIISEKSILSLSLLHVFSDILPGYRIRLPQETETKFKLKKETKKLLNYEQSLLRYYKKYLDCLQVMIQEMKSKRVTAKASLVQKKVLREIGVVAVKCLCELLVTRFSFNYFKNIASILVSLIANRDEELTTICCDAMENVFKADKLGESSFDIVKLSVKLIKERKFCVPGALVKTFLCLNLREAKVDGINKKADMKKVRKQLNMMSRKEKRQKKKIKHLEVELREAEAHENVEHITKFHTETLNKIFWVFFHVLKDDEKLSLISPILEGLSKFAHLINLEYFDDLNLVLCSLMECGKLTDVEKLHCMYTLFTVLSGQAESLNIDPHKIYCHMYQILLKLCNSNNVEQFDLAIKCLDLMVLKRRKRITFNRILSFIKRLSTVSLQTPLHGTLALLSVIRVLLLNVKSSDILLDVESTLGSGIYFPDSEDPEHCNAQSTALWELHLLKRHYNPVIKTYSQHILYGCPSKGRLCLPDTLAKLLPEQSLRLLADVSMSHKIQDLEENEEPPKKKVKFNTGSRNSAYEDISDVTLSWKSVQKINFANCLVDY